MGIEYHDTNTSPLSGQVHYKMKHIRLQNRHLKLRNDNKRPRHIHFDEDGNVISETGPSEEVRYGSMFSIFNSSGARVVSRVFYLTVPTINIVLQTRTSAARW